MVKDNILFERSVEARSAVFADFPNDMHGELVGFLKCLNIDQLYCHQVEMFNEVKRGNNVVITTSTASGKTLSFLLPIIDRILINPLCRAFFIYPTKALASDQFRAIKPFLDHFGKGRIVAGVYDGDTPVNERSKLRASANIILTNPEMINSAFLPNHSNYGNNFIFSNLNFIVIDELHSYKGAFGSHMANLFKRLDRVCSYYNCRPQFLCSSATIANPLELASNICGRDFVLVDKDGSPSAKKKYVFIQPPVYEKTDIAVSVEQVASEFVPKLVVGNRHFIAFCKSRRAVEIILKQAREKLKYDGVNSVNYADKISGYRGGYVPAERKEIESKMINGELSGLISTNVLELGIDIGKVDSTVLVGYPKTRASFWQQSGRAGRKGNVSTTYLILDDLPIDQFIGLNPDWIFGVSSENAIIDKDNTYIQLAHLRAAAAELPISLDDSHLFSKLSEIVPVLLKAGELKKENGKFVWCGGPFPAGDYSLRNMDSDVYQVIDEENNVSITEVDETIAFRDCHEKSIYIHDGYMYCVSRLDLDCKKVFVRRLDVNYYTVPFVTTQARIISSLKSDKVNKCVYHFGDINVSNVFGSHKKVVML
ncbi:MAG: DEAD/DEAH box helicase [Erysipelotrichaceae bacterium]